MCNGQSNVLGREKWEVTFGRATSETRKKQHFPPLGGGRVGSGRILGGLAARAAPPSRL